VVGNSNNFSSLFFSLMRLNLKRRSAGGREDWSRRASKNEIEIYIMIALSCESKVARFFHYSHKLLPVQHTVFIFICLCHHRPTLYFLFS